MNEDNNKNLITELKGELKNIREICQQNYKWIKRDTESTKQLLDNHCERIRETEKNITVIKTETKPIINFYNKVGQFMIGLCIVIGGIIVGGLYFLKDKLK